MRRAVGFILLLLCVSEFVVSIITFSFITCFFLCFGWMGIVRLMDPVLPLTSCRPWLLLWAAAGTCIIIVYSILILSGIARPTAETNTICNLAVAWQVCDPCDWCDYFAFWFFTLSATNVVLELFSVSISLVVVCHAGPMVCKSVFTEMKCPEPWGASWNRGLRGRDIPPLDAVEARSASNDSGQSPVSITIREASKVPTRP